MSGLDLLRGRALECAALLELLGHAQDGMLGQRLTIWRAAIAHVEADYDPPAADDAEDQEDLDPAPSEEDLAVAAEAVALFQGAVEAFTPRDQPPAPEEPEAPPALRPEPAPVQASTPARKNPVWIQPRIELAANMWRMGRSAAQVFAAVNRIPAPAPVKSKQDVFNKAHVMGWKRDVPVRAAPPPPAPEPAPAASAEDDEASPAEIKAAIRAGKRAKAIAWEFGIELEEAQSLCAEVDAEGRGEDSAA
jgi:hypothetical protein